MADVSRRALLAAGLGISATAALAGCNARMTTDKVAPTADPPMLDGAARPPAPDPAVASAEPAGGVPASPWERNDGSWRDTGAQPNQPAVERFGRGDTPPQYVVVSWDGAGENSRLPLLSHFRGVAKELKASMTLFLSGIYFVPKDNRTLYRPPGRPPGTSAIPFLSPDSVHATIDNIGKAWLEGHEIGTHFNGHFCGADGVGTWSVADWQNEIEQAMAFVASWRTTTGFSDLDPLPFDYRKELVGGRAPCLEGSATLRTTADGLGWRYDTSATGTQTWPQKVGRLWALDLPSIPFGGRGKSVLAMDYNMMANQSGSPNGAPGKRAAWQQEAVASYLAGFQRAYDGNRAPYVIGNHFEDWNGGIYMTAVEQAMRQMATHPDTRFVSFRQLCDVLDAQQPAVLDQLRTLPIGTAPAGGWKTFLKV